MPRRPRSLEGTHLASPLTADQIEWLDDAIHGLSADVRNGTLSIDPAQLSATVPVSKGGTGSTSFASGSIVFSNGTILTEDNANLYWDDTNNFLGVGTASPTGKLTIGSGQIFVPNGSTTAPSYSFTTDPDLGIIRKAANQLQLAATSGVFFSNGGVGAAVHTAIANTGADFSSSVQFISAGTVTAEFGREADYTYAVRSGANGQRLRVYNTYTDAANYERLSIGNNAAGAVHKFISEAAGTGVARDFEFSGANVRVPALGIGGVAGSASTIKVYGTSSGSIVFAVPAAAGANTITFPAGTTDFSATGGANQLVKQSSAGGALTVGTIASANLSDGTNIALLNAANAFSNTGTNSFAGDLTVADQVALGGALSTNVKTFLTGSFTGATVTHGLYQNETLTGVANNDAYGSRIGPTIVEAASGTHALLAGLYVDGLAVSNGSAATTNAASVYVAAAPSGITPTGAAYALWVDSGTTRLDGGVVLNAATGGDQGAGTINIDATEGLYIDGAKFVDIAHTWSANQIMSANAQFGTTSNFSWVVKAFDTVYQAASDGFVVAWWTSGNGSGVGADSVQIKSDASNPPTTLRQQKDNEVATTVKAWLDSLMCPIKKSDYYKVVTSNADTTAVASAVYWVPLGTAG